MAYHIAVLRGCDEDQPQRLRSGEMLDEVARAVKGASPVRAGGSADRGG